MSSSLVHFVVGGDAFLLPEAPRWLPLRARAPPTLEYCLFIESMRSFFSLASLRSSSLDRIRDPELGAGGPATFVFDEALETLDILDLVSSAAPRR